MGTHVNAPHDASSLVDVVRYATGRQVGFIEALMLDNGLHDGHYARLWKITESHRLWEQTHNTEDRDGAPMAFNVASQTIDWLKRRVAEKKAAERQQATAATATEAPATPAPAEEKKLVGPGVYRKDAVIYVVQPSKANPGRMYAKKIVESAPRYTDAGEVVDFEFVYDSGAIWKLTEADKMTLEDAKHFMIKYGRCIKCRRHLKAAKTLKDAEETGILVGPVCRRYFQ